MAELVGMQQVLQLTATVERAQMAAQSQTGQIARAFEKELDQINERLRDQTEETQASEETTVTDDQRGKEGNRPPLSDRRRPAEEERDERQQELIAETGHGGLLDVRA